MFRLQSPEGRQVVVGSAVEAVRLRASGYVDAADAPTSEQPSSEPADDPSGDEQPAEQPAERSPDPLVVEDEPRKRRGHLATS